MPAKQMGSKTVQQHKKEKKAQSLEKIKKYFEGNFKIFSFPSIRDAQEYAEENDLGLKKIEISRFVREQFPEYAKTNFNSRRIKYPLKVAIAALGFASSLFAICFVVALRNDAFGARSASLARFARTFFFATFFRAALCLFGFTSARYSSRARCTPSMIAQGCGTNSGSMVTPKSTLPA